MGSCVAYGCTNRPSKKIPGITFHKFPKDENRRRQWIIAVRRKNWMPSKYSTLCSKHFTEDMIDRSLNYVLLKENAIPTIFDTPPSLEEESMPHHCIVPYCRANYKNGFRASMFSFPTDDELRQRWIANIPRDFVVTKNTKVCERHFNKHDIMREDSAFDSKTGRTITAPLLTVRLRKGAVPSIFPDCSLLLSQDAEANNEHSPNRKEPRLENEKFTTALTETSLYSEEESGKVKIKRLKNIAVPSLYLPVSENADDCQDCRRNSEKKPKSIKKKKEVSSVLTTRTQNSCSPFSETSLDMSDAAENSMDLSIDVSEEQYSDTKPNIITLSSSNSFDPDNQTPDCVSDKEDTKEACHISLLSDHELNLLETDYSAFDPSPLDSEETLRQKLQTMVAVNKILLKEAKLYKNKYKVCEKEVAILKGVIEDLKLINAVSGDS